MESRKLKKIPAFFKPFVAEDRERRLLIPQFFTEFMKDRLPDNAFIRDRKENFWHVEVSKRGNKRYFEAGWTNFVQDKSVQYGDCFVFQYNGGSFFDVKIFGDTACEKGFSVEGFETDEMEEEEDEGSENYVDEEGQDKEMEEEEDEHNADNRVEMDDDERIFDLGIVDRPKNPYFVAKLCPKRKSDLRVPTDVIRDFNLKLPESINVCDEQGRTWPVVVKKWGDGRTCLTKGWRAFWKWNAVKPDDKCLCEFVPANDGSEIRLRISIIRAKSLLQ